MVQRRQINLATLEDIGHEIDCLHRTGYEQAGKWNLSQTCEHLADWMTYPIDGFPKMPLAIMIMMSGIRLLRGKAILKKIIEQKSMASNMPTDPRTVHAEKGEEQASVDRLQTSLSRLVQHRGSIHPSPFFGAMNRQELIALQTVHCNHHLSFLIPKVAS